MNETISVVEDQTLLVKKPRLFDNDIAPMNWRSESRVVGWQEAACLLSTILTNPKMNVFQRDLKMTRVNSYARQMSAGTWANFSVLEICELGNEKLTDNGIQRLAAQVLSRTAQWYIINIGKADNIEQVSARYLIHDKNSPRTSGDDWAALDINQDISKSVYSNLIAAVKSLAQFGGRMHGRQNIGDIEKLLIITDWEDIALKIQKIGDMDNCHKHVFNKMLTTAIMPAVLCQFFIHPEQAATWWTNVCVFNGGEEDSSRRMYRYLADMGKVRGKDNALHMENVCRLFNDQLTGRTSNLAKKKTGDYVLRVEGSNFGKKIGTRKNELFYDTNKRGNMNEGHETVSGCFRPFDPRFDVINNTEDKKKISADIANALAEDEVQSVELLTQIVSNSVTALG